MLVHVRDSVDLRWGNEENNELYQLIGSSMLNAVKNHILLKLCRCFFICLEQSI